MATRPDRRDVLVLMGTVLCGQSVAGCLSVPENGGPNDQLDSGGDGTDAEDGSSMDDNGTTNETDRLPERSPLANPLPALVDAADRAAFAAERELQYNESDDRVKVEIELEEEGEPPDEYLAEVIDQFAGLVIAWVEVDDLVDLALDEDVRRVQQATEPILDQSD